MNRSKRWFYVLLSLLAILPWLVSCSLPTLSKTTPSSTPGEATPGEGASDATLEPITQANVTPAAPSDTPITGPTAEAAPRIGIRSVGERVEFYNTVTGETFTPRGANYLDFSQAPDGTYTSRFMATDLYDSEHVRTAFRHLAEGDYNTVRIFFDLCDSGPTCIGQQGGSGLNPQYLDNLVDVMRIARETGLYLILAAHKIPLEGNYWQQFEQEFNAAEHTGFETVQDNSYYLHPAGIAAQARYWENLMAGLAERSAPFDAVLGWELQDELAFRSTLPPLSLRRGQVTIANGQSYDMGLKQQKRQMLADGTLYWMDALITIIKSHDPQALITTGFLAPDFPNQTEIGGDEMAETALILEQAEVDFFDFHAYGDTDLTIDQMVKNFGLLTYEAKPVIMGETGLSKKVVPSAYSAQTSQLDWIASSCAYGFSGWLHWTYDTQPEALNPSFWSLLDADDLLFNALAPANLPDPCTPTELAVRNVAWRKPTRASSSALNHAPAMAVDGLSKSWISKAAPQQWIEVDLQQLTNLGSIGFVAATRPSEEIQIQAWGGVEGGKSILLATFANRFWDGKSSVYQFPAPMGGIRLLRINSLGGKIPLALKEVEAISAEQPGEVCLGVAATNTPLYAAPDLESEILGKLYGDNIVVVDGKWTNAQGATWWRLPIDHWTPASALAVATEITSTVEAACNALPTVSYAPVKTVPVTFVVTAPHTDAVYLAGDFGGADYPSWYPDGLLMRQGKDGRWMVTLRLPAGATIQFTFTRGAWLSVERDANCQAIPNHTFDVPESSEGETIEITIDKWRDLDECP